MIQMSHLAQNKEYFLARAKIIFVRKLLINFAIKTHQNEKNRSRKFLLGSTNKSMGPSTERTRMWGPLWDDLRQEEKGGRAITGRSRGGVESDFCIRIQRGKLPTLKEIKGEIPC